MKIFLAGATGVLGRQLIPMLTGAGHRVVCMTRSVEKLKGLRALGVETALADAFDRDAVMRAVTAARPDAVVHQMTALAHIRSLRNFDKEFALTNRLRTVGTRHLLDAAQAAGARIFVAQSYAGWPNDPVGIPIKTEEDPLNPEPPKNMRRTLDAILELELAVTSAKSCLGVILRYGGFYGPGTSIYPGGEVAELVRKRRFPVIDGGGGIWSFVHIKDAARATRLAVEHGTAGIYNIVDDEPAPVSLWLPYLAEVLGARPPLRIRGWLGKLLLGEPGFYMMTETVGSSNGKAKRVLGWKLAHKSWRDGFREFGEQTPAQATRH